MEFMPGLHPPGMKEINHVSIANPCNQNWDDMLPDHGSKFCNNCRKTITDFSKLSHAEILSFLSASTKVCGRFDERQLMVLNSEIAPQPSHIFNRQKIGLAAALLTVIPFVNVQAKVKPAIEQGPVLLQKLNPLSDTSLTYKKISGHIVDAADKGGVPGVSVTVKGKQLGCVTDVNGNFSLNVPDTELVLVVSFIGYKRQEIKVNSGSLKEINLQLQVEQMLLGEVTIVSPSFIKRTWYRIKRAF